MSHTNNPVFELLSVKKTCSSCQSSNSTNNNYGCFHRIYGSDFTFSPGDFIYWDSEDELFLPATEGNCDLLVISVDNCGTWIEVANSGEFKLKNYTLKGPLYINNLGEITNTQSSSKVGFIENGNLYLLIERPVSAVNINGFIRDQRISPQLANYWILGQALTGNSLTLTGQIDSAFSSVNVNETAPSIEYPIYPLLYVKSNDPDTWDSFQDQTATPVNIAALGLNSVIGSASVKISNSIMSHIVASSYINLDKNPSEIYEDNSKIFIGSSNEIALTGKIRTFSLLNSNYVTIEGDVQDSLVTSSYRTRIKNLDRAIVASSGTVYGDTVSNSLVLSSSGNILGNITSSIVNATSPQFNDDIQNSLIVCGDLRVIGFTNNVTIIGYGHRITRSSGSSLFGINQVVEDSPYSALVGQDNTNIFGNHSFISGSSNILRQSNYSLIAGNINKVNELSGSGHHAYILGFSNETINSQLTGIIGEYNTINSSNNVNVFSRNSEIENSSYTGIYSGADATIRNSTFCSVFNGSGNNEILNNSYMCTILNGWAADIVNSSYCITINNDDDIINSYKSISLTGDIINGTQCLIASHNSSSIQYASSCTIIGGIANEIIGTDLNTIENTIILGNSCESRYSNQYIIGNLNDNQSDSLLEVGGGNGATRRNAFRVLRNGVTESDGVALKISASTPTSPLDCQLYAKSDGLYLYHSGVHYRVNLTVV